LTAQGGVITKIKSDGGSSSYYDIPLPPWLIDVIVERGFVKTEELIEVFFRNDFDYGNLFKSLVRANQLEVGGGKEGNSVEYEMNKVIYSAGKIKAIKQRKENV